MTEAPDTASQVALRWGKAVKRQQKVRAHQCQQKLEEKRRQVEQQQYHQITPAVLKGIIQHF